MSNINKNSNNNKLKLILLLVIFISLGFMIIQGCKFMKSFNDQKILSAWSILNDKSFGNSGKGKALEILAKSGESLEGINLSIKGHKKSLYGLNPSIHNLDLSWNTISEHTNKVVKLERTIFNKLDLNNVNFSGGNLFLTHFINTSIYNSKFDNSLLKNAIFSEAQISNTSFDGTNLNGAFFNNARFDEVKFQGAELTQTFFENIDGKFPKKAILGVDIIFNNCFVRSVSEAKIITNDSLPNIVIDKKKIEVTILDKNNQYVSLNNNSQYKKFSIDENVVEKILKKKQDIKETKNKKFTDNEGYEKILTKIAKLENDVFNLYKKYLIEDENGIFYKIKIGK